MPDKIPCRSENSISPSRRRSICTMAAGRSSSSHWINARRLPLFDHVHGVSAAGEVKVERGTLAVERVRHGETLREQPTPLGIYGWTVRKVVLRHHVVN